MVGAGEAQARQPLRSRSSNNSTPAQLNSTQNEGCLPGDACCWAKFISLLRVCLVDAIILAKVVRALGIFKALAAKESPTLSHGPHLFFLVHFCLPNTRTPHSHTHSTCVALAKTS